MDGTKSSYFVDAQPSTSQCSKEDAQQELTAQQKAAIERNRQRALLLRQKRQEKLSVKEYVANNFY